MGEYGDELPKYQNIYSTNDPCPYKRVLVWSELMPQNPWCHGGRFVEGLKRSEAGKDTLLLR